MVGSVDAPEPGFRPGVRWGVVPRCCSPIGRPIGSPPFDTRITRPWSRARQFPISRSERRASSAATPPGPRGAGAEGHPGMLDRRPPRGLAELWAMCRILATEVHRRLISDCNGRQTDLASSFGRGLGSMSPPLAVVFVSVHYIGLPSARVAVYAWLTVPTRGGNRGRGHRGCIAVVVACGARRPFALGSWLFARVLGKRGKRGYNKWSASRLLRTLRRKG